VDYLRLLFIDFQKRFKLAAEKATTSKQNQDFPLMRRERMKTISYLYLCVMCFSGGKDVDLFQGQLQDMITISSDEGAWKSWRERGGEKEWG
jgi:hypothetical protein